MNRTDIINKFIDLFKYESYLEIGIDNPNLNFNKINCKSKIGVDPNPKSQATFIKTSDDFFAANQNKFDIIFIDGLHHSEQVIKDIDNSLKILNDNGTIIVHDCNPTSREMQEIPRSQGIWTGDVWRAWIHFRQRPDLFMQVLDCDYGVGIIRKGRQKNEIKDYTGISYFNFNNGKQKLLNLIPAELEPVSICIPAFEQYGWGSYSLKLLFTSMINLKGRYEIVLVDNANNQTIFNTVKQFSNKLHIQYVKSTKRGVSYNINLAMDAASADLIKPMFQDDIFISNDAINDISFALKFSDWVLCSGHSINDRNKLGKYRVPVYTDRILNETNTVGMPSVIAHKCCNLKYDDNLKTRLDTDFYWQLKHLYGNPVTIKKPLIGSRYWKQSTSTKQENYTSRELPYIYKKYNITEWL